MPTFRKLRVFTKSPDFVAATKVVEAPLVAPAPTEVRVKQIYAGVNALDKGSTAGFFNPEEKVPFDVGHEGLGLVDAVGGEVPEGTFKVGQTVLVFYRSQTQGFSEYAYTTPDQLVPVPSLDPAYLVTLINGLTASISLDQAGHLKSGDKVLITAAAGGTGQIAVQWAKQRGATVVALTSSEAKAKYLRELGADLVINYKTENLDQVLKEKFPSGLDIIWETIGGETFKTLFNHLAIKGRLLIVGAISAFGQHTPIENQNPQLLRESKSLNGFNLSNYISDVPTYLPQLITGICSGTIKAQVDLGERSPGGKFFGVEQIHRGQALLQSGQNLGKVVVQLQKV